MFKNFALARSQQLQLRVETFNVFNQTRFGQPGTGRATTFGVITRPTTAGSCSSGIKYQF